MQINYKAKCFNVQWLYVDEWKKWQAIIKLLKVCKRSKVKE